MIVGRLKDIGSYYGIHENLDKAIRFLEEKDPGDFGEGSYPIDGENVYMNRFDYQTGPESGAFEAHRDFLDIHIVTEGRELLAYAHESGLRVTKEYEKEEDYALFVGEAELRVLLEKGRFAICFPEDAHIPKISAGMPGPVKKAVVKVRLRAQGV